MDDLREQVEEVAEDLVQYVAGFYGFGTREQAQADELRDHLAPVVEAALLRERSDTAERIVQAIEAAGRNARENWHDKVAQYMLTYSQAAALARSGGGGTPEQGEADR